MARLLLLLLLLLGLLDLRVATGEVDKIVLISVLELTSLASAGGSGPAAKGLRALPGLQSDGHGKEYECKPWHLMQTCWPLLHSPPGFARGQPPGRLKP